MKAAVLSLILSSMSAPSMAANILYNDMSKGRALYFMNHLIGNSDIKASYRHAYAGNDRWFKLAPGCPASLKDVEVTLMLASGAHVVKAGAPQPGGKQKWQAAATKDTSKLNDVTYDFLLNGGECGQISISKEKTEDGKKYAWKKPSFSPNGHPELFGPKAINPEEIVLGVKSAVAKVDRTLTAGGITGVELEKSQQYDRAQKKRVGPLIAMYRIGLPNGEYACVGATDGEIYTCTPSIMQQLREALGSGGEAAAASTV